MHNFSEADFVRLVKETLLEVENYIDEHYASFFIDIEEREEVLKIDLVLQKKIFIINKHSYLRELWYSSPVSGPHHFKYDFHQSQWITKNFEFFTLIYSELDYILGV